MRLRLMECLVTKRRLLRIGQGSVHRTAVGHRQGGDWLLAIHSTVLETRMLPTLSGAADASAALS